MSQTLVSKTLKYYFLLFFIIYYCYYCNDNDNGVLLLSIKKGMKIKVKRLLQFLIVQKKKKKDFYQFLIFSINIYTQ